MTRISLLCWAIAILISQTAYAQPSLRLSAGGSKVVADATLEPGDFSLGYNMVAAVDLPISLIASISAEGGYIYNKIGSASSMSVKQANVGIKLNLPLLYAVGLLGYNQAEVTATVFGVDLSTTNNGIGAGAAVGLNLGRLVSEARVYHSTAAESTYLLGLVGIRIF